ncbi:N-acetyltransferase [Cohnella endophytica]|uniref:N-acetyltransferase n=1 Tax=Cohnella endophytica TaxID=2419778 RepID=A0A494XLE2_9BACL|nr:GNAT family protein [Cohnella endophytica]RKP51438.1 N-acetyltransferase [Cohnella endophytica]
MSKFDTITTDRLAIRTLDMRDRDVFFEYRSMPEVSKYQSWRPKEINEVEKFIAANRAVVPNTGGSWLQLAVCLKNGQLVGDIGVHFVDDDYQIEIGYTLSPEFQGKGYASEAVRAVIDYLFTGLRKHRITGSVDPDNAKSIKLLENLGFRKEAHFVKSYRLNDQWYDDCVYAILADEWK